jgi:hypothetical protein
MLRPNLNSQTNLGNTPLMLACKEGHLMAAAALIGLGADLALLSNAGASALRCAEGCVARDAAPPAAGAAPASAALLKEHEQVVALLKVLGAP